MLRFILYTIRLSKELTRFQYISCYGLSECGLSGLRIKGISIHLMLRFIGKEVTVENLDSHFNTSHVTVYLHGTESVGCTFRISIHLMLRFISSTSSSFLSTKTISIHLMLRFISNGFSRHSQQMSISIHLMLRFIASGGRPTARISIFQYISCYGLSNDFKPFLSCHLSSFPLFYVISAFLPADYKI